MIRSSEMANAYTSAQFVDEHGAEFHIQVEDDLGVGVGPETMSAGFEIGTEFLESVNSLC